MFSSVSSGGVVISMDVSSGFRGCFVARQAQEHSRAQCINSNYQDLLFW